MPVIKTHEICAEGVTAHLVKVLAKAFGVAEGTVRAWRHPKESDLDPTGTGKHNPLDGAERFIRIVHQYNPGNARAAAQYFADLVNELDRAQGEVLPAENVLARLRDLIKEESDVPQVLIGNNLDQHTLRRARKEISEERAALERLDAAVEAELQRLAS